MPHSSRLPVTAFLVAALVAAGCTLPGRGRSEDPAPQPPAPPAPVGQPARWRDCPEVPKQLVGRGAAGMTYQCATVSVPRDWAAPGSGKTFEVALLRARSNRQRDRIGSLVINPGGPGGSGIDTAVYLSFGAKYGGLPDEVLRRFDIVGFDPRGVNRSSPVKCISDDDLDEVFGADQDPVSEADFAEVVTASAAIGAGCGSKLKEDLPLYSTEQAARDIDAIRAAVGDDKLTYLGYSYGTLLGATYAQLFPTKIRAFVLDGAVDPRADAVTASESQAKGFERAFANFVTWCRNSPGKCPIADDPRAAVTTALEKARVSPLRGAGGREATAGWVFYAIVSSLYTEPGWEKLAKAFDKLAAGDPKGIFELADDYAQRDPSGHYSNMFDAFFAINCADDNSKITVEKVRQLQSAWRKKYPLFGGALAIGLLPCANWPGKRDPYPTGAAAGAPPIVVVGTVNDPATPYEQTARLADMLGVGKVLTWEGEGHTAYPETPCITKAVDDYLIDLRVPPDAQRCPAR